MVIEKPNNAFSCQVGEGVLQLRFVEQLILAQTDLRPQEAQILNDDEGRYEGCSSIP